jgi:hypothetical protein
MIADVAMTVCVPPATDNLQVHYCGALHPANFGIPAQAPDIAREAGSTSSPNGASCWTAATVKCLLAGASAARAAGSGSPGPGNKARHAGLHHGVEPDARRDAVPNLPHGVFRQGRKLEVLLDAVGRN